MSEEKEQFKEFFEKHPSLENAEYYSEFPDVNKSTIRSWKYQLTKPQDPEPTPSTKKDKDYSALEEEHIKLLIKESKIDPKELDGLDNKSKILILRNRIKLQGDKKTPPGGAILPQPLPSSRTDKKFGIDEFITFDKVKDEIRMKIPMEELLDPEKNKRLGLLQ